MLNKKDTFFEINLKFEIFINRFYPNFPHFQPIDLINYNNRIFKAIVNDDNGFVTSDTTFYYRQKGKVIWATYEGGGIDVGTITGVVLENGNLNFNYQHVTIKGVLMTGYCESTPEKRSNGRIRLFEKWHFTSGAVSEGVSIIEEVVSMG